MNAIPDCIIVPWWKVAAAETPQHNVISHEDTMDTNTADNTAVAAEIATRFPDIDIADGEHYAGLSRDHATGAWYHLVLLPGMPEKNLKWQEAIDWAKSVGGELPTRFDSALLYANLRDKLDLDNWHWTATPYAGDERYAWMQTFHRGNQSYGRKGDVYRAVAVRRVPV